MNTLVKFDKRHGGPWDRGNADSWYRRGANPHYFVGDTGSSPRIEKADMTADEIAAYMAGYNEGEASGDHKEWY